MKTYPLHIITIQNPDMLTQTQIQRVCKFAGELLQTVGVKLRIDVEQIIKLEPDKYAEPFQMSGAYRSAYMKAYKWEVKNRNIHIFIPPIIVGRYKFFGGVGGCVCCKKGNRVSCSSAFLSQTVSSTKLVDKLYTCGVIMAHELGHVIGLHHKPFVSPDGTLEPGADKIPANIMSPWVNVYSGHRGLAFLPGSKKIVRVCLK